MTNRFFITMAAFLAVTASLFAQGDRKDKTAVTYEELYDEPSSINKLFVGIQPLYGELFATNVNAGFGMEAVYFLKDKAHFKAHFRKTYSQTFFDFSRDLADKQSSVANRAEVFNYYEFGGTYHIKDFEESSKTKMFLYKKSYKGDKWAARVPLSADVPCKVRKIYGARLGAIIWDSSTDLARVLESQGLTNTDLKSLDADNPNASLPEFESTGSNPATKPVHPFTNISATGLYVGGSMTWIKNVAVNFDKFEEGIDDLILTTYLDILYTPSFTVDDIIYQVKDANGQSTGPAYAYDVSPIKLKSFGFRVGIDGRFNRQLGWAYGAEVGYRPSFEKRTFYAMLKISFPVFGTDLDYKVESFGK